MDVSGSGNDGDHKDNKEDENQEQSFNLPAIAQLAHNHPHPLITIIVFIRRQPAVNHAIGRMKPPMRTDCGVVKIDHPSDNVPDLHIS